MMRVSDAKQRDIMRYHFESRMPPSEISAKTGINECAVRATISAYWRRNS